MSIIMRMLPALLDGLLADRTWRFQVHDQLNVVVVVVSTNRHLVYQVADKKKPPAAR